MPMHAAENNLVLVTGGGGFIGSHLVEQLLGMGRKVRILERPGTPLDHLPLDSVDLAMADIRDPGAIAKAAMGCDQAVHLAANPNLWARNSSEFEEVNHQGTRNVLQCCRSAGVQRVVYVSTESILSPPGGRDTITEETVTTLDDMIGPYCRSKWLAEQAAMDAAGSGQDVVIVRPSIPVGPGDRWMGPLTRMMRDFCNGRIKGHLAGDLNMIDVRDVAGGICKALDHGDPGRPYLLVNENWTVLELLQFLGEHIGRAAPRWRVPYALALAFASLEEFACRHVLKRREPMATVTGVRLTQRPFRFDGRHSVQALDLEPMRDCRESIIEMLQWCSSQPGMGFDGTNPVHASRQPPA
ncbi:MAG: NAD-dependent epimerase/dehydratase family protein [Planctomycetota bacterium]|nr:NAD-dependent epimerase/dehydratase family protein [Planctomycetota bacterium]